MRTLHNGVPAGSDIGACSGLTGGEALSGPAGTPTVHSCPCYSQIHETTASRIPSIPCSRTCYGTDTHLLAGRCAGNLRYNAAPRVKRRMSVSLLRTKFVSRNSSTSLGCSSSKAGGRALIQKTSSSSGSLKRYLLARHYCGLRFESERPAMRPVKTKHSGITGVRHAYDYALRQELVVPK